MLNLIRNEYHGIIPNLVQLVYVHISYLVKRSINFNLVRGLGEFIDHGNLLNQVILPCIGKY